MNLYKGELMSVDGRPYFRGAGYSMALGEIKQELKEGPLEVGIRPEDIHIVKDGTTELRASVDMISHIGSENYIHARLGDESITLRVPKETSFHPGMVIYLTLDPKHLHIFQNGRRI
jgi:sn-glycerol 3-phosphate transport system ATP-binding protein